MKKRPSDEVLVGSGSFSVDSRRAVEVLRKRQLEASAETAPLLWARLAVLSGATRTALDLSPGRFVARFDGAPLPRAFLARPYDALLGNKTGGPAERLFGSALLHLAHPGVSVTVASGPVGERSAIVLEGPGAAPPVPWDDGADETVVTASWSEPKSSEAGHPSGWDAGGLALWLDPTPMPVTLVDGGKTEVVLPWKRRWGPEAWTGTVNGLSCGVRVLRDFGTTPRAQLGVHGVGVETALLSGFPLSADGWVDSPELVLDASLSKPVVNEAYAAARAALGKAVGAALSAALERHGRRMRLAAAAMRRDRSLLRLWRKAAVESLQAAGPTRRQRLRSAAFFRRPSGDAFLVSDVAAWNAVWRAALVNVLRVRKPHQEAVPVCAALPEAPLVIDRSYHARSLGKLAGSETLFSEDVAFVALVGRRL